MYIHTSYLSTKFIITRDSQRHRQNQGVIVTIDKVTITPSYKTTGANVAILVSP